MKTITCKYQACAMTVATLLVGRAASYAMSYDGLTTWGFKVDGHHADKIKELLKENVEVS